MIKPQINDMAEDICERLIEINTNISYLKKKTSESTEERKNRKPQI